MTPHRRPRPPAAGFTFIEVLVALLLLSLGVLGLARLQLESLQGTHAAYQRSIASLAAQDAQERLWRAFAQRVDADPAVSDTCPMQPDVLSALNEDDGVWQERWDTYLPGLEAEHVHHDPDADTPCTFAITVRWQESRFADETDEEGMVTLTYDTRLPGKE
ncbi:type IV pilus modification protein PilV [Halomonas organivorans]